MNKKIYVLLLLASISILSLYGQSNTTWISFYNTDTTLMGYVDKSGRVKIEPKFTVFTLARKFDHIVAVSEETMGKWNSYYLTKSGKIVGKDSMHIFDNSFDCESEGFIRFRDLKTDKVGMFNKKGEIVVPAIYNDLTRVRNGIIAGLKGAEKKYGHQNEHFSWKGGQEVLIDTMNNLLIEDFIYDNSLDFFSIEKTNAVHSDTTRKSFRAKDGSYYSFVDFEKEFRQWFEVELLHNLTVEKLITVSYDTLTWSSHSEWIKTDKEKLINANFSIISNGLAEIRQAETDYFISKGGLNPFMYEGTDFEKYFTNCGESKDWVYPTMSVIISHNVKGDMTQNHYEFLRTDTGYQLISLTIRDKTIKRS